MHKNLNNKSKYSLFKWITYFFIFIVFYFAVPCDFFWTVRDAATVDDYVSLVQEGSLSRRIALLCLGLYAALIFLKKDTNRILINGSLGWACLFFVTWVCLSFFWADNISLCLKRLGVFVILCFSSFAIARKISISRAAELAYFNCGLALLMGVIAEIGLNTFRPFEQGYRFSGMVHPVSQGFNCSILLISAIFYSGLGASRRYLHLAVAFIAFIFLLLTGSRTTFIGTLIVITLYWNIGIQKNQRRLLFSILAFLAPILLLGLYFILDEKLISFIHSALSLGRDINTESTLTGRTPLWIELLKYVGQNPILGFGYESFWTPAHLMAVSGSQDWAIGTSHLGYLDIVLGVGLIGLTAYVLILGITIKRSLNFYFKKGDVANLFVMAIFLWVTINSFTAYILFRTFFESFLCMILIAKLAFVESGAEENRMSEFN